MHTNDSILKALVLSIIIFLMQCTVACHTAHAQTRDTLLVKTNDSIFKKGDTINFEVSLQRYPPQHKAATIQLWIEDVQNGRRWKYRYPFVNGYLSASLVVDSSFPEGYYAFNFLLQKAFFKLTGTLKNPSRKQQQLQYVIIARNKQTLSNTVTMDENHFFNLGSMLFEDSAFIMFSVPKQKRTDLMIDIATPLDSAFTAISTVTKLIQVGKPVQQLVAGSNAVTGYVFNPDSTPYKIILPEVLVNATRKRAEQFQKDNVSGLFGSDDAIIIDGLDSDELANAPDLYNFLSMKIGGLRLQMDEQTGERSFVWRNAATEIYINEIRLDPDFPIVINPSDIALIKVFRPGTVLTTGSGAGGAIAIYTKTNAYKKSSNRNYSFFIIGYTPLESIWK